MSSLVEEDLSDDNNDKQEHEIIPEEDSPTGILPVKKKKVYFLVAEAAANRLLRQKNLYDSNLNIKPIHLFGDHFRVNYYDKSKVVHSVLVKIRSDMSVREIKMDH